MITRGTFGSCWPPLAADRPKNIENPGRPLIDRRDAGRAQGLILDVYMVLLDYV